MKCPISRRMIDPCPFQRDTDGKSNACLPCIEDWRERAALISDGCRLTQQQAEAVATEQLREKLDRAEKGQKDLFQ